MTGKTVSNFERSEYFKLRYRLLRQDSKIFCPQCNKEVKELKLKLRRCNACRRKLTEEIRTLYVDGGNSLKEIGEVLNSGKKMTGERIRQIFESEVVGGFSEVEHSCHLNNRKKKRIEEKTGNKIEEIIKIIAEDGTVFNPKSISIRFNCSWECGKSVADYLLQWHLDKVENKVISLSREEYLDSIRIDLTEMKGRLT